MPSAPSWALINSNGIIHTYPHELDLHIVALSQKSRYSNCSSGSNLQKRPKKGVPRAVVDLGGHGAKLFTASRESLEG